MAKRKDCFYCKHFMHHFVKSDTSGFMRIFDGHCLNRVKLEKGKDYCDLYEEFTKEDEKANNFKQLARQIDKVKDILENLRDYVNNNIFDE